MPTSPTSSTSSDAVPTDAFTQEQDAFTQEQRQCLQDRLNSSTTLQECGMMISMVSQVIKIILRTHCSLSALNTVEPY